MIKVFYLYFKSMKIASNNNKPNIFPQVEYVFTFIEHPKKEETASRSGIVFMELWTLSRKLKL